MSDAAVLCVLIVEDEPLILLDLEYELLNAGLKPSTAGSVQMALNAIDADRPDVAVLDVNLGGGTTCEPVAMRLRELGIPFLLHSGDLDRVGEMISRFDVPILPKPTPGYRIVKAVRALRGAGDPAPDGGVGAAT